VNEDYIALDQRLQTEELTEDERDALRVEMQNAGYQQVDAVRPDRPESGEVRDAEDHLENWGNDIVVYLLDIAHDYVHVVPLDAEDMWFDGYGVSARDYGIELGQRTATIDGAALIIHQGLTDKVRFMAVQRLTVSSKRSVILGDGERGSEEQQTLNREIVSENNTVALWAYGLDAGPEERAEVLALWDEWFELNEERFTFTTGQLVQRMFFDTRFANYWSNLAQLKLGTSIRYRRPVTEIISEHWKYSIFLSLASLFLAYFISIPLGVLAAVKQNQFADRGVGILLFVLYSLPSFFVASLLQTHLTSATEHLQWFPVDGFQGVNSLEVTSWERFKDIIWHLVLPVTCLTYGALAVLSRYARTGLLDVIRSDYIRTARAKGLSEFVVIVKHAVRNGMIPILTLLGTTLPVLIGGSIIIEYIFTIDGMGKLMITAITYRDYNVIMGVLLISSVLTLFGILLSDISYALVDPRISFD
jgi:peptide/nickel transport system permease protein